MKKSDKKTKIEIELKLAFCEYLTNIKKDNKKRLFYFEFPITMVDSKSKKKSNKKQ
tara:strand:- start:26901 stop:27068 length:168 start_codon:yes stop_codon:yes gene_type:complete